MKSYSKYWLLSVLTLALLFQSCALWRGLFRPKIIQRTIPSGIDPELYRWAKVKADSLIASKESVSEASEIIQVGQKDLEISESLWNGLDLYHKKVRADSTKRIVTPPPKEEMRMSEDGVAIIRIQPDTVVTEEAEIPPDTLTVPLLTLMNRLYLDNAMSYFLKARYINRFDLDNIRNIADLYSREAERFRDTQSSRRSIEEYEYVARYQRGYHWLFRRLGENYEGIKDWQNALENYKEALRVFDATSSLRFITDSTSAKADSISAHDDYIYYWIKKAEMESKMYRADSALVSWLRAAELASASKDINYIHHQIRALMWDSLNIQAMVLKDSIETYTNQNDLVKIKLGYLRLLRLVKTQKARDDVESTLAILDYNSEGESKREAIQRMVRIVQRMDDNKATINRYEAPLDYDIIYYLQLDSTKKRAIQYKNLSYHPEIQRLLESNKLRVDSTYKVIFKSAGQMCFEYGQAMMREGKYEDAKLFLNFSSAVDWPDRFKALYELARFHSIRSEPRVALAKCYTIIQFSEHLNSAETKEFLNLLVRLFRNRLINQQEVSRQIYQIYSQYLQGGPVPWEVVHQFLEPFKA
ncbi:hypothetical protein L0128_01105 [candidate division KSB1 bacterium]|nr:hypothetical protein [candidate division KSB1 bacterium]